MKLAADPSAKEAEPTTVEERVLALVRGLAEEAGGPRAARAVSLDASLERDVGLGSLERVELLFRLEHAFGRRLDESLLRVDTARGLARALGSTPVVAERAPTAISAPLSAAADLTPFSTIHEALWRRAEADPTRPHVFMREDDGSERTITYGSLLDESRRVAGGLRDRGIAKGDTVGLMLPTGLDFLRTFQGILMAGAIPVPIYPPARLDRLEEYLRRQAGILADAGVRSLITIQRAVPLAQILRSKVPTLDRVEAAQDLCDLGASLGVCEGSPDDAAFIQYTSGSTGAPKGVLLTHRNLLANIRAIDAALQVTPADVGVSWLPLYHDMGLIGSWLLCLCKAMPIDIQSPLSFLARPERWLWAIHRRRGTLSAAPNFAYELCVRRIRDEDVEGLDLSSWRCAFNGAEPVSPQTVERFVKRFSRYGFRREAMTPVYGLAENSVALSVPKLGLGPRIDRVKRAVFESEGRAERADASDPTAIEFACEGPAIVDHEVRIVDDAGAPLPDRHVGRLVFRGPSMTSGYYRNPQATAAITLPDGWLDSGDLAYMAEGEIYVTGRLKDVIIKGGRNIVPHEIEEAASEIHGVRKGCVVALGVMSEAQGTESLVVVAETRETDEGRRDALCAAIRERVDEVVGLPPDQVVLVPPGGVPKTSSGKIRRASTKEMYVAGELGRTARLGLGRRLGLAAGAGRALGSRWAARARRVAYGTYVCLAIGTGVLLVWPAAVLVRGRRASAALERLALRALVAISGCKVTVEGLEHLPRRGPALLASNHTSYADIPFLRATIPLHFVFVAKQEALGYPLVGIFFRKVGHIAVDRDQAERSVTDSAKAVEALARGDAVLYFPEGTFTSVSGLRPFKLGLFKAAVETRTPIIPMALRGSRRVLRDGSWIPHPRHVSLWIGPPIHPGGTEWSDVLDLRDRVAEAIAAHCGEPRLDLVSASRP